MIPAPLLRVRVDKERVMPGYLGTRPAGREAAEALLGVYRAGVEERWPRGRLEEAVLAAIGDSKDHKLWKGLARVLEDRSEFAIGVEGDPVQRRLDVFRLAAARGPLALERGPLQRPIAEDVLAEACVEASALYADRPDEQQITSCDVPDLDALVARYDVALAQSVLLHATEVRVFLVDPRPERLKQLFRWIKFHQLVHTARRVGKEVHLVLDGPISLFSQSTRYGLKLAQFLPALLLQDRRWTLEASISWTKRNYKRTLHVSSEDGLLSTLPDTGAYVGREQQALAARWPELDTGWTLTDRTEPIDLDGRSLVLPDFTFTKGKKTAHLEVVGYWRKKWLADRVAVLKKYGPGNLVLAVSRRLLGDEGEDALEGFAGAVVPFKEVVPPKAVLEAIERVAR